MVELLPVFGVSDVRAGGDGSHSSSSSTSSSAARHKARGAVVGAVAVRHALARGGVETLTLGTAPFAGRAPVATLPVLGTVAGVTVAGARCQRPARVWVAQRVRRSYTSRALGRMVKKYYVFIQRFNVKPMAFALSHTLAPTSGTISPQDIRHSATLSSFKSQLKTFLYLEYFT